jgi:hypothetical protein
VQVASTVVVGVQEVKGYGEQCVDAWLAVTGRIGTLRNDVTSVDL